MSTKICVNLPVKDLGRSTDFFTKLGFSLNPQLSGENMECLVISDDIAGSRRLPRQPGPPVGRAPARTHLASPLEQLPRLMVGADRPRPGRRRRSGRR
jgi:hypothetical protein